MFLQATVFAGLIIAPSALVFACAPELYKREGIHPVHKRQNIPNKVQDTRGWTYESAGDWNTLSENWGYCFNGTQQSPIALESSMGYTQRHRPTFDYPDTLVGDLTNWDFGPQFTLAGGSAHRRDSSSADVPTMQFEEGGQNETVHFQSWHTHAPAEHTIDGWRPKAEIHLVHYTEDGTPRAVVGFHIDVKPSSQGMPFFSRVAEAPNFRDNQTVSGFECNLNQVIETASGLEDFFTYQGSLTTPPCSEGLRWFFARNVIYLNDDQMQDLLDRSTYSARPTNRVWKHNVNL